MKKPIAIFLHGGPGFKDYLEPYFHNLNSHFECVFYDQLTGPELGIEELIAQLNGIVSNNKAPIFLIGHSWGGVLGVEYTAKYPEKVSALAIIATGLTHHHWFTEFYKEKERLGLKDASAEEVYFAPQESAEGKILLDKIWESFSEETFDSLSKNYAVNYDLITKFSSIEIPIINIFGEKDVRFPSRITKTFSTYNSNVVNIEVMNAGHFPFLLQKGKEQIHQALKDNFLKPPRPSP